MELSDFNDSQSVAPAVAPAVSNAFDISLEEFCARLSSTDRRVEMIGAFFKTELAAGRTKNNEAAFAADYVAFCNQPA